MRNLFLRINIALYASVGIISKHSLHILTISQNKRLIHSQHASPKLYCGMPPLGIFSWNYGFVNGFLWMAFLCWEFHCFMPPIGIFCWNCGLKMDFLFWEFHSYVSPCNLFLELWFYEWLFFIENLIVLMQTFDKFLWWTLMAHKYCVFNPKIKK